MLGWTLHHGTLILSLPPALTLLLFIYSLVYSDCDPELDLDAGQVAAVRVPVFCPSALTFHVYDRRNVLSGSDLSVCTCPREVFNTECIDTYNHS